MPAINIVPSDAKRVRVKIIPTYEVEIDGKKIQGTFTPREEWEGMVKFVSDSPHAEIIMFRPAVDDPQRNIYNLIPKMIGGNRKLGDPPVEIEAVIVNAYNLYHQ